MLNRVQSAGTIVHRNLLDIRQEAKKSVEQIPYIDSIRRLAIAKIDNVWSVVHTIKTREVKTLDENQLHLIQEGKVLMDSLQGAIKNLKELQRKELKINIGKQPLLLLQLCGLFIVSCYLLKKRKEDLKKR
jgi:hypothetical protein